MPSLPFFKKKEESTSDAAPATEPAVEAPTAVEPAPAEPAVDETPAGSETSGQPAAATEKPAESKRGFFSRKKSTDNTATASESESETPHSRIPSLFGRKAKPTTAVVKEEEKENVPEPAPEPAVEDTAADASAEAPAAPVEEKKDADKVRRRISLFQRRNRADGAVSEPEVTDNEKDAHAKAKRTSFWKSSELPKEPIPEDPRLTEAKAKVTEATEAESAAKAALESAKKALREARTAVKTVEAELLAEAKKAAAVAKTEKKEETKPADEPAAAPQTAIEPPTLPQVTAAA